MKIIQTTLMIIVLATVISCKEDDSPAEVGKIEMINPTAAELAELILAKGDTIKWNYAYSGEGTVLLSRAELISLFNFSGSKSEEINFHVESIGDASLFSIEEIVSYVPSSDAKLLDFYLKLTVITENRVLEERFQVGGLKQE